MTLLNNWEATYFDFNEEKLIGLIGDAAGLGVDMFLLDDGWFANKYPRSSDHQGLGDWDETADKLPNGIGRLVEEATKKGIKFGLWIEPEMVNPKSELYEKHKDWVIHLPNRDEYYFRNQLVLDLSNPKVQDFVFGVVDDLMTKYPGIAFFKWDCNSPITNIYSSYLKEKQSHLYIDYVRGLYNVLERIKTKYPDLPMMLCSGGSGRIDYEALRYFTEFWPSDNTDPIERLFIQWGYSQLFPAKTLCAHVTTWNHDASIKFRTDVAMMGKLGLISNCRTSMIMRRSSAVMRSPTTIILNRWCSKETCIGWYLLIAATILPPNMWGKIRRELLSLHSIFTPVMARNCCLSVCKDWMPVGSTG